IPDWIENINKDNIIILGEVESMRETVNDKGLVIVPLRIGGGIRIKILEALSWGKVVISTSAGAEGICDDEKSEFMIIENDPIKFAEAINYYLNNTEMMEKYEINAEKFIRNNYSKQIISENIKLKISSI
ncbi:glycosyltransferase, partial [Clostridium neonatale]|uniref:glycosyltransferase n=1 Tax=Clostridium neonatale TaxID=137838 RepID=UPI003D33036C